MLEKIRDDEKKIFFYDSEVLSLKSYISGMAGLIFNFFFSKYS